MHTQVKVTPPQSFTGNPPTPPPSTEKILPVVSSIIAEIKARQSGQGYLSSPWARYTLTLEDYTELLHRIQKDKYLLGFVEDKTRYDYIPYKNRLILRMPTALHELVVCRVVRELQSQLEKLAGSGDDSPSSKFAGQVKSWGSATLKFPDAEYGRHDPDAQFRHTNARFPGVVIEVSYSQKRKDLCTLADDYILGSDGEIQAVIGLDIEYLNNKKATLSVWRPGVDTDEAGETALVAKQTVVDQMIRDEEGNANKDSLAGLHLELGDFAVEASVPPLGPLTTPISISATRLHSYLEEAEQEVSNMELERGPPLGTRPWTTKRRRQSTPPEELDGSREKRFRENEEKALQLAEADDSSYKTISDEDEA